MDDGTPADPADRLRARLEQVLDGYFDVRTAAMVQRVIGTATPDEVDDPAAMDRLFAQFVALLEERYDRDDPGWRASAESFLRAEFDRQLDDARAFNASFDNL